ncbi:hypothetical protein [Cellulomonas cellasea]|uniref:Uncharacterized protein n=1 Tax=Cellulomonas cellasea TaxID=43670 RepID=A0A7W4YBX2_9CELL|nr:hypothetical protein [Cellulomonas cellasea]MBB2924098.1 hypothetical protein [Cellulomonas cellasea]
MSVTGVEGLVVADASGAWAIRSQSSTVYVDVDALFRATGPGSSRGMADGRWVPLTSGVEDQATVLGDPAPEPRHPHLRIRVEP